MATSPENCVADYEALMRIADERLYVAKESGRIRVADADKQTH